MSEITEALQRIEVWLQNHMPNRAAELKPGLTKNEIEEQVKDLPFNLPEEVYELYQWHDGSVDRFVFEQYDFLSLKYAIEAYYEWWGYVRVYEIEEARFFLKCFPVFELWCEYGVLVNVVCDNFKDSKDYSIRMLDTSCKDFSVRYSNLKDLILHVADWYESAQYYERDDFWEVEAETEYLLELKHMSNEYITYIASSRGMRGLRQQIYQRYLNGDISLSDI
ncbi:MAG: hypothetical protein WBA41_30545 [Rivularia sp. (in: cyanobacteria)]